MRAVHVPLRSEPRFVRRVQSATHHADERQPSVPRRVRQGRHAATREPAGEPSFCQAQTTEVFDAVQDPHLVWGRQHDAGCLIAAKMAGVRCAVATMTGGTNPAGPGEIQIPRDGSTLASEAHKGHVVDGGNARARPTPAHVLSARRVGQATALMTNPRGSSAAGWAHPALCRRADLTLSPVLFML